MRIKSLAVLTGGIFLAGSMIRKKLESKASAHEEDLENSLRAIQKKEHDEAVAEKEKQWNREYKAEFDNKTKSESENTEW